MRTARGSMRALVSGALCVAVLALAGAAGATFNTVRLVSVGTDTDATVAFAGTSADGSKVFFTTTDKLVAADTDAVRDVYDRSGGTTTLLTPSTTNAVTYAGNSADGSKLFFTTIQGLDPADADGIKDIYSVSAGVYTLLTPATAVAPTFNGSRADGSILFTTTEALDAGDTDVLNDVYQRAGGTTTLLTPGTAVATTYEGASADGSHVFFSTTESLAAGDTDAVRDVYDRSGGVTTLVTPSTTNAVTHAGNSADGTRVFFTTIQKLDAINDTDSLKDIYQGVSGVYTLLTPGTSLSPTDLAAVGSSSDGSHVFFTTAESLDAGDGDAAVDLYDRSGGTTTLVTPGTAAAVTYDGSSTDGSHVFFNATDSLTAGDTDGGLDDVYERTGGTTNLVSQPGYGAGGAAAAVTWGGASTDSSHAFFATTEKLAGNDADALTDVYEGALDTNAPAIVLSQAPNGSNGWFKTAPATLHAVATDDYTITSLACTPDGGASTLPNLNVVTTVSTITADLQVSSDGDYTVTCVATDAAHNPTSPAASTQLRLDTTPPTVMSSQAPDGSNGWFKLPPASMHVVAIDALSIGTLACTVDGSPAALANVVMTSTVIAGDLQTSAPGDHSVACTGTDSAGNAMVPPIPHLKLDATPPAVTFSQAPNGTNGWFKTPPARVRVTATDTLGLATLTCTLDGSPVALTSTVMTALAIAGDVQASTAGDHAVVCTGTDTAGNAIVPPPQRLKLDTTAPALTVANIAVDATGPTGATVPAYTTSSSDATSPPATVACTPPAPKLFPTGDSTVSCTATDQAGNATTRTFVVHVRTVVESIAVLKGMVTGASPPLSGVLTPILGSLLDFAARYAADPKKKKDACGKLKEFTDRIAVEVAKPKPGMTPAQATSLTAYANRIKFNLGC